MSNLSFELTGWTKFKFAGKVVAHVAFLPWRPLRVTMEVPPHIEVKEKSKS
jgi:hypothetical protein